MFRIQPYPIPLSLVVLIADWLLHNKCADATEFQCVRISWRTIFTQFYDPVVDSSSVVGKNLEDSEDLNKFAYCQVVGGTCPLESSYLIRLRPSSQVAVVHVCRSVETKEYDNLLWSYKVGDGNESVEIVNLCSWIALGMRCFIKRRRRKHWRHSISRQYWF